MPKHNKDPFKLDKTAFSVVNLDQADDDLEYWLTRSAEERMLGLEVTRQILYGRAACTARLQRVLEITQRT